MYTPNSQRDRLADLLEMLVKRDSGDQEMIAEKERRETASGDISLLIDYNAQENRDIRMLHGMGFIRSGTSELTGVHRSLAGIFDYTITEDGREFLAEQRGGRSERRAASDAASRDAKKIPTAFISYSWDDVSHKNWVKELATRLRKDGVDVKLDQWDVSLGDSITEFMETAIRESDFVVIICTPRYKARSDSRLGGVGYEESVITGEVFTNQSNRNKFIPVLRSGEWIDAAPSRIAEVAYADLSGGAYSEQEYARLRDTLLGRRETAPPIGGGL